MQKIIHISSCKYHIEGSINFSPIIHAKKKCTKFSIFDIFKNSFHPKNLQIYYTVIIIISKTTKRKGKITENETYIIEKKYVKQIFFRYTKYYDGNRTNYFTFSSRVPTSASLLKAQDVINYPKERDSDVLY